MPFRRSLLALPALLAIAAPGIALAQAQSNDPSFRLNNRGQVTIREVYVSSSNDQNWGPDRLGREVLAPGRSVTIRLPRGQCLNDIRLVFENGQSQERRRLNTCQFTELNVPQ